MATLLPDSLPAKPLQDSNDFPWTIAAGHAAIIRRNHRLYCEALAIAVCYHERTLAKP